MLIRRWTAEECRLLRDVYQANQGFKHGWLKKLSTVLGRNKPNIVRKAKSLGLVTDRARCFPMNLRKPKRIGVTAHLSKEERFARKSQQVKELWKRRPHPRGMLGKHHSPEVCERMSRARFGKPLPKKTQAQRDAMSRMAVERMGANPAAFSRKLNRGLAGRRTDLNGQYFRSRFEANYARFLNFTKTKWEYEKKTFWFEKIKRGVRSYTPDFYLPERNEYHEVKGWMDRKSQTKLKRMKKYYPNVVMVVIDGEWFKAANRQGMCRLIPGWECNHKRHRKTPGVHVVLEEAL